MKSVKICFGFIFSILLLGSSLGQEAKYLDNALYVKFKESSGISAKNFNQKAVPFEKLNLAVNKMKGVSFGFHREAFSMRLFDNPILEKTFTIRFDSTQKIEQLIELLENDPNVEFVERVPIFKTMAIQPSAKENFVPDDPFYNMNGEIDYQWYLRMIDAEGAWAIQPEGDPSIKVGVVDGAIWGEHPELNIPSSRQSNVGMGTDGNSAPPEDVDQNEVCTTLYASEEVPHPCPSYSWSHGTHCAGVIGAKNDTTGMASIASGVTLIAAAAHLPQYPESVINAYEGIAWAAEQGAKVINCSWGIAGETDSDIGNAILKECFDNNIVIVAAAGNENTDKKSSPAASIYTISVGSVDADNKRSYFSNYGTWVNITAPGGFDGDLSILSSTFCQNQSMRLRGDHTFDGLYYDEMSGTSMATPLVAGLCALMLSRNPDLTPEEIRDILQNTSTFNPSNQTYFMPIAGTINAKAALEAVDNMKFDEPVRNLKLDERRMDSIWFSWEAPENNTHEIIGYRVMRNGTIIDSCTSHTEFFDSLAPSGALAYMVSVIYEEGYTSVRKELRVTIPNIYKCSVSITPLDGGTVTGTGKYTEKAIVTLKAKPNPGYRFKQWFGPSGLESTEETYSFPITADVHYYASFEKESANSDLNSYDCVSISPNPTKDLIRIESGVPIKNIWICTLSGHILRNIETKGLYSTEISLESFKSGIFLIKIQTETGVLTQKVVKI